MSHSVKRAISQNDPLCNDLREAQCNFSTASVKRVRYGQNDMLNVPGAWSSSFIPQEALPFKDSYLNDDQPFSTNTIEPNHARSFQDNINWPYDLPNDLSYMPLDSSTSYNSIANNDESIILCPSFSSMQDIASYSELETTSYYTEPDELVVNQAYTDHPLQSGSDNENQVGNFLNNRGHSLVDMDMSWINDASLDEWINFDWVNGRLYQAAPSSTPNDSDSSRVAQIDDSMFCPGLYLHARNFIDPLTDRINCAIESTPKLNFQQKPYREILPLLQKPLESGPRENQSMSNATKKPRKYGLEYLNSEGKSKLGRSKSFVPERARAIAEMRVIRACLRCRIKRVSCTPGEICEACLTSAFGLERTLCVRNNVEHSTELLLPVVNSSFHRSNIENIIYENIESFCGNKISIQISSGPNYPPISLQVEEFRPTSDDFLVLQHVKTNEDGRIESRFMHGYTPPLGLPPHSGRLLREKCQEHIDLIAKGSRCEGELYYKHTSIVPWEIFKAIEEYYKSTKDELVGKSIALYTMNMFMTQILLFTEDSADAALQNLKYPAKLPYTRTLTSKLISLQVKEEMYNLSHEATKEVLEKLEAVMIDKTKNIKFWTSSFCAISIICMLMEIVQVATDFKIVQSMVEGEGSPKRSRSESKDQCQRLDDCLMSTLETMFHKVFKSRKRLGNRKHERGFNPIRDGVDSNDAQDVDTAEVRLVAEIRRIIAEQEKEIGIRLETPSFDTNPDDLSNLLAEHLVFREKNSGRLVSRFLRSFFKSD